jgi:hypothetical protein
MLVMETRRFGNPLCFPYEDKVLNLLYAVLQIELTSVCSGDAQNLCHADPLSAALMSISETYKVFVFKGKLVILHIGVSAGNSDSTETNFFWVVNKDSEESSGM